MKREFRLSCLTILVLFVVACVYSVITKESTSYYTNVASGEVQDKFESTYYCGYENLDLCTAYNLTVEGLNHRVDKSTYVNNFVGSSVTLRVKEYENPIWLNTATIVVNVIVGIIGSIAIVIFLMFMHWGLFHSDDKSFKNYFKRAIYLR